MQNKDCFICHDNGPNMLMLCCQNYYHFKCLQGWFDENVECPSCKVSVDTRRLYGLFHTIYDCTRKCGVTEEEHGTRDVLISIHTEYQEAVDSLQEKEKNRKTSWNYYYDDCSDHPGWFHVKELDRSF